MTINKKEVMVQAEEILSLAREDQAKKEMADRDVILPVETVEFLRMTVGPLNGVSDNEKRDPNMYEEDDVTIDNLSGSVSLVIAKLDQALIISEFGDMTPDAEIPVLLRGRDVDVINNALLLMIKRDQERLSDVDLESRLNALFDDNQNYDIHTSPLDRLLLVNKAYTSAGGKERPAYREAIKPYQIE